MWFTESLGRMPLSYVEHRPLAGQGLLSGSFKNAGPYAAYFAALVPLRF